MQRREYWRLKDAAGKPPGVMGWWPSRAVTFLENHDTVRACPRPPAAAACPAPPAHPTRKGCQLRRQRLLAIPCTPGTASAP